MIKKIAATATCLSFCLTIGLAAEPSAKENKAEAPEANPKSNPAAKAPASPEVSKGANAEADRAWDEVVSLSKPPSPPADWKGGEPSEEQIEAFKKQVGEAVGVASEKAREFYIKYPNDPRAVEAQKKERMLLMNAIQMGQTNRVAQLRLNPILSDEEKFQNRVNEMNKKAMALQPKGMDFVVDAYVSGIKELQKEFPNRDELSAQLLSIMRYMDPKKKAEVARHIVDSNADESIKASANALLKTLPGQPVEFKFTAIDGREIDTSKMKGKVLLIDFWATWCGPCMQELPNVKAAYDKYKDEGFEIIGISGDRKLADLQKVVKREKMAWPQYFDKAGPVSYMEEFGIEAIPTMWLVDKKGIIRETEARQDLEAKVKALLAEK